MKKILKRIGVFALIFMGVIFYSVSYASTSLTYVYDANGNLTSGDGRYYEYNNANQLVKVRQGDQNGLVIAEYVYDYTGQRIKKIENGVPTYYIGKHFETTVSGSDTANTSYYFANGERVAKKNSAGSMYYYHADHLGGTNVVTNSSGNLVERVKYYPFGEIREGGSEKYQFTGKEKDKLTDWNYFEARYYDPAFSHFTQADTVEPDFYHPQDLNKYAYVTGNPLRFNDPSGHWIVGALVDRAVNWAGNTRAGSFLGDQMLNRIVDPSINNASPQAQAAYYSALATGLGHTYEVTKSATSTTIDLVKDFYSGDAKSALKDSAKLFVMFAAESGKIGQDEADTMVDILDVLDMKNDVKDLGKRFHFSMKTYKQLVHGIGSKKYSLLRQFINKTRDPYRLVNNTGDLYKMMAERIRHEK